VAPGDSPEVQERFLLGVRRALTDPGAVTHPAQHSEGEMAQEKTP